MENDGLQAGDVIASSSLPVELQPDAQLMAETADELDCTPEQLTDLTTVPAESDITDLEGEISQGIAALEGLSQLAQTLESYDTLTPAGARAAAIAIERFGLKVRLPSKEAFATGDKSVTFYAREAVAEQQQSLIDRILAFFAKWAKVVSVWIESTFTARGYAKKAIAFAQKETANVISIPLTPNGFQGRGVLVATEYAYQGMERDSAQAMETFTAQMRDLLRATSGMFAETPNSAAGVMRSAAATHRLATFAKDNGVFNKEGLAGVSWTIDVGTAKRYEGGDTLPAFSTTREPVQRGTLDGQIQGEQFRLIVQAAANALANSEMIVRHLQTYATKMGGLRAMSGGGLTREGTIDAGMFNCLFSAASALRTSAAYYDRITCAAAADCGRALKYAKRKP